MLLFRVIVFLQLIFFSVGLERSTAGIRSSNPSILSLLPRLGQGTRFLLDKPVRAQYSSTMAARFGFFLSQSLVISRLPWASTSSPSKGSSRAVLNIPAVVGAIGDALSVDNPDDIPFQAPSMAEKPLLDSNEQRGLFAKNFASIIEVLRKDLENIENGIYKMPYDLQIDSPQWNPLNVAKQVRRYITDRRTVLDRSRKGVEGGTEIRERFSSPKYPDYYLQNFHFQTDGWLSQNSAELYDYQVESLFMGTADAMRRQILPSMVDFFKQKNALEDVRHLDIATGTGRFLSFVLDNFPDLPATCLDLSPFYLQEAKKLLSPYNQVKYVESAAEEMPFPDASFDSISCVYMFHELPPEVRSKVVAEMARVLKPGGKVFFVDSAQKGEVPMDRILTGFTIIAHEPYYLNYTEENLSELFKTSGFVMDYSEVNWVSKCVVFTKGQDIHNDIALQ